MNGPELKATSSPANTTSIPWPPVPLAPRPQNEADTPFGKVTVPPFFRIFVEHDAAAEQIEVTLRWPGIPSVEGDDSLSGPQQTFFLPLDAGRHAFLRELIDNATTLMAHEMEEWLQIDGEYQYDPHGVRGAKQRGYEKICAALEAIYG